MPRIRDQVVHLEIKTALRTARGGTVKEKLENAWSNINQIRLGGNCNDELAPVEHYLYTRFLVARYGPLVYNTLINLDSIYRIIKIVHEILPNIPVPQEGPCPPSPPSIADWRWTHTGLLDGWDDFFGLSNLSTLADKVPEHPRWP